jgi:ribonuclease BN (tRNA processing enzyme)
VVALAIAPLLAVRPAADPTRARHLGGDAPPAGHQARTHVVLLGTGTPNADPRRSGPALAIVVDDVPYLVDAGPGIVRRAAAAAEAHALDALEPPRLATVFLTHLHSDHTTGLPDLLLTSWTLGRERPLTVVGPEGTAEMMEHLRAAYRRDVDMRLYGLEPANDGGHRVDVREIGPPVEGEEGTTAGDGDDLPRLVFRDERVRVLAFPVPHGSWPGTQAFGYRFETPDRVIVVSGDTGPSEAVVTACDACDVLVHEVYARSGWERREPEWQRYHASYHTSGVELGELARRARPGLLVLTHQLLWGATPDELLAEVRTAFDGRVVYGEDLDVY